MVIWHYSTIVLCIMWKERHWCQWQLQIASLKVSCYKWLQLLLQLLLQILLQLLCLQFLTCLSLWAIAFVIIFVFVFLCMLPSVDKENFLFQLIKRDISSAKTPTFCIIYSLLFFDFMWCEVKWCGVNRTFSSKTVIYQNSVNKIEILIYWFLLLF